VCKKAGWKAHKKKYCGVVARKKGENEIYDLLSKTSKPRKKYNESETITGILITLILALKFPCAFLKSDNHYFLGLTFRV